jgi:hypothetical protein
MQSKLRYYSQDQLTAAVSLRITGIQSLLLEEGSCGQGQFGNPEEGERLQLGAIKQWQ